MMKSRTSDPHRLDVVGLASGSGKLSGTTPASGLLRLMADAPLLPDTAAPWSVAGEMRQATGGAEQPWLHLRASARVTLTCQRCLQPMTQALEVDRWVRFVASEAEAERLDEESEEDVLALPPRGLLDAMGLLEDELILALPLVPRHDACPQPLPLKTDPAPVAASPFRSLSVLKRPTSSDGED